MKQLQVPFLPNLETRPLLSKISELLDSKKRETIEIAPWPEYSSKPVVSFSIAYNSSSIFLKYYVIETETKAVYTEINQPVYRDSCVEFFIAFEDDQEYYNLEFNSIGICMAGFGQRRENRKLLPEDVIGKIEFETFRRLTEDQNNYWELCLAVPATVFCHHNISTLEGKSCKVNFYKCGDDLLQPHFLVWNNINSKEPNFHLPEFFGGITLSQEPTLN